jgi:hypothetical protein
MELIIRQDPIGEKRWVVNRPEGHVFVDRIILLTHVMFSPDGSVTCASIRSTQYVVREWNSEKQITEEILCLEIQ